MSEVRGREMRNFLVIFCLVLLMTPAVAGAEIPAVTGISPSSGVNNSLVAITNLAGTNFINGATVMLTPVTVNPLHKGSIINGGSALLLNPRGVFVSGNYAYVASTGSNALEIVDVTNPAAPTHKGSISNGGSTLLSTPRGVYVSGNYAYVASTGSNALEIVDVTNPAVPMHAGSLSTGVGGALLTSPYSVYVSGNYAYVASYGSNALEIVDVTNPAAPTHTGSIGISTPSSVKVSGSYAYVTSTGGDTLWIIDVTNPAVPVPRGSITITAPSSVYISGNYAYVANTDYSGGALDIVNITNPAVPVLAGDISNNEGGARFSSPESVYVSGNYAYVVSPVINRLEIVDVTNPADPVHTGSISNGGSALLLYPRSVFVVNNYAYVASFTSNALEILDTGTVTATGVNVATANLITCTLNLNNKLAGLYNVVVTNPDGNFGTRSSGFTIFAAGAPVASFTVTARSGVAPLTVTFTDTSTQVPTSWNWSFGDGLYSNTQNPEHTYSQGGVYTVSLTVTNAKGTNTLTQPDYIGVIFKTNDGIAIFRPSTGYWYFDKNLDGVINSSFRYGGSTDRIIKGNWTGNGDGIAIFRPSTGYWYFDYELDGIVDKFFRYGGSTDQIITGDWDGDGKDGIAIFRPSTGYWYFDYNLDGVINQSFRYGGTNDRIITGDWDGDGKDGIAIFRNTTGYWYFDYELDGIVNKFFRYGGSTDEIITGDWDGDGKDGIAIFRPSTGYWYFDYNLDGVINQSFRYGGSTDRIVKGDWQGTGRDGIAIFRPSTGFWYFDNYLDGRYDKSFRYGGSTDRIIVGKWISVAPTAAFSSNVQTGTAPLTVQFTGQTTGSAPLTYSWDFGDGNYATTKSPSHVYSNAGTYTVTFTATNIEGSDSDVETDYIMVTPAPEAPVANFTSDVQSGSAPLTVTFTDNSTGTAPLTYAWDFTNDGIIDSTLQNPSHQYSTIGSYTVNLTVTNAAGNNSLLRTNYITVTAPTITLSPASLSAIYEDIPYSQAITASGGTAPYAYSVTSGTPPTGLTLSGSGTLSGTPTTPGTFEFRINATDTNNFNGSRSYSLTVNSQPAIMLSPASLSAIYEDIPYSQAITASGGTAPYAYSITSGTPPNGLTLSGSGTLSGTPTTPGTFEFRINATDTNNFNGSRSYSLTVNSQPAITLSPASLTSPVPVDTVYSETITASGGTAPYTFIITSGVQPTGLILSTGGTLSGTPTVTGLFSFTVNATDANNFNGTRAYNLEVT